MYLHILISSYVVAVYTIIEMHIRLYSLNIEVYCSIYYFLPSCTVLQYMVVQDSGSPPVIGICLFVLKCLQMSLLIRTQRRCEDSKRIDFNCSILEYTGLCFSMSYIIARYKSILLESQHLRSVLISNDRFLAFSTSRHIPMTAEEREFYANIYYSKRYYNAYMKIVYSMITYVYNVYTSIFK